MRSLRAALFAGLMAVVSTANANCYVLVNNTNHELDFNFGYNMPVGAGTVVSAKVFSHSQYPFSGQWCINDASIRVSITYVGMGHPSWQGPLVFGDGHTLVNPSGTYTVNQ